MLLTLPDRSVALVTDHALGRWQEYTCPLHAAWWSKGLLQDVVTLAGTVTAERPAWLRLPRDVGYDVPARYVLAGDYALVVVPVERRPGLIVVTVVARGAIPRAEREERNEANARRRRAARRRQERGRDDRIRAARRFDWTES